MYHLKVEFEYKTGSDSKLEKIFSVTKEEPVTVNEVICEALFDIGPRKVPDNIVVSVSDGTMLLNDNVSGIFSNESFKVYEFNAIPKEDCDLLESPTFSFISKYSLPQVVPYARTYALVTLDADRLIVRGASSSYGINIVVRQLSNKKSIA